MSWMNSVASLASVLSGMSTPAIDSVMTGMVVRAPMRHHVCRDMRPTGTDTGMTAPHRVGFVVFDGMTLLDVSGPVDVLARSARFGGGTYEQVLISAVQGTTTVLAS